MLFFFNSPTNNTSSTNRLISFLLFLFLIFNILISSTNASLSYKHHQYYPNRHWIISNEDSLKNHDNLERMERGTGFFVYRKGEYLLFIPDRRHHFTKNFRPYIGRRRR